MTQVPDPPPSRDRPPAPKAARPLRHRPLRDEPLVLTFSPVAWLKLKFFCHAGDTEVGGFAVSAEDDPLSVEDFLTVRQLTTAVTVAFDDAAVADYFDAAVDRGLPPSRFARVWCHTHPGESPEPSMTDEDTFARVFGACDWAVMFILSRTGRTYARLAFSAGPGGSLLLPVNVDWEAWPQAVLERPEELGPMLADWAAEFEQNVHPVALLPPLPEPGRPPYPRLVDNEWLELVDLSERQARRDQSDEQFIRLFEAEQEVLR
jgi:hypothetical protein